MARVILFLVMLISGSIVAQENHAQEEVKRAIETFFEGFHKGDTTLMKSVMVDKFITQTAYKNKEGQDILVTEEASKLIKAVATRLADQKWEERLIDFKIQVNGNMANAWVPYAFWYNDTFIHCGVNSFQLFHDNGQWKIIYLIDTRRKEDCQD
ncbi:nuclear transport factor 2 family protein [Lacinutrix sp. WUR7]|uniref:nuclear transport factor 2 family protein n=1 Tax=Lacinutrix sp. WUR7 TaxID=2653681 RepID=UPI00193E34C8|nr:nuclear transport factor 2 family protein [Lacinutrix sp. WUR7]QRM90704.1 nuclear transport factor 2 family protein [Lacinutrix sp. WUR7]